MKNKYKNIVLLVLFTLTFSLSTAFAQVPQAINFQAIARDGSGNPMVNTNIQIRLSVLDSAQNGATVYQELRALQTNAYGSFSFQIGVNANFVTIGTFQSINWSTGNKHLKLDYDPTNTFTFSLTLGTIKFVTVPYAFTAENVTYIDATGAQDGDALVYNSATGKFEPGQVGSSNVIWDDVQNKPTFAEVALTGNYNDLLNKPTLFSGIYSDLTDKPTLWDSTWATIKNKPNFVTVATSGSYNDLTDKPITVDSIASNGDTIYLSNGQSFIHGGSDAATGVFTHYIGEEFGGGVVFQLWKDLQGFEHGLIVDLTNASDSAIWSNVTGSIGVSAQSTDGLNNSNAIISQLGHTNSAAKICLDLNSGGNNDWYLPSLSEFVLLHRNFYVINKTLSSISGATQLEPSSGFYWTSSENNASMAYMISIGLGSLNNTSSNKTSLYIVRAIRSF